MLDRVRRLFRTRSSREGGLSSMGELRTQGPGGDVKLSWDEGDEDSLESARKVYRDLTSKGYSAFSIKRKKIESKGKQISTFDPAAEEIILVPPMQGG